MGALIIRIPKGSFKGSFYARINNTARMAAGFKGLGVKGSGVRFQLIRALGLMDFPL